MKILVLAGLAASLVITRAAWAQTTPGPALGTTLGEEPFVLPALEPKPSLPIASKAKKAEEDEAPAAKKRKQARQPAIVPPPGVPSSGAATPAPASPSSPVSTETGSFTNGSFTKGILLQDQKPPVDQKPAMDPAVANGTTGGSGSFYAAAALYIIKPYYEHNPAFTTTTGIGTPFTHQEETEFDWNYHATPAFWLGWLNSDGWGIRGHYFFFDESSTTTNTALTLAQAAGSSIVPPADLASPAGTPTFGAPSVLLGAGFGKDMLSFSSNLKIQAADLEATRLIEADRWWIMISGGGRYLYMSQDYSAALINQAGVASEAQLLRFGHNFSGGGPTTDIFLSHQIGNSPLAFYGDLRGSLLVGTTHTSRNFAEVINDPTGLVGGSSLANPTAFSSRDTVLPVLEAELGVQYSIGRGRNLFFIRMGVVDQTYFGAGSAALTGGNLSLFGAQMTTGILH